MLSCTVGVVMEPLLMTVLARARARAEVPSRRTSQMSLVTSFCPLRVECAKATHWLSQEKLGNWLVSLEAPVP